MNPVVTTISESHWVTFFFFTTLKTIFDTRFLPKLCLGLTHRFSIEMFASGIFMATGFGLIRVQGPGFFNDVNNSSLHKIYRVPGGLESAAIS